MESRCFERFWSSQKLFTAIFEGALLPFRCSISMEAQNVIWLSLMEHALLKLLDILKVSALNCSQSKVAALAGSISDINEYILLFKSKLIYIASQASFP